MSKNRVKILVAFGAFCVCAWASSAFAAATPPDLASADWSVNAKPNLAANPPSDGSVEKFLIDHLSDSDTTILRGLIVDGLGGACAYSFGDLRRSGNLSLVVSLDPNGGARWCTLILIYDKTPTGFEGYSFDVRDGRDLPGAIQDAADDGNHELVFRKLVTSETGNGYRAAFIPVIYGWTGSGYADISKEKRFEPFYRKRLETLRADIAAHPPNLKREGRFNHPAYDCRRIEAAAIESFLGIHSDATLNEAIKAANSADPNTRKMAIAMLSLIAGWGDSHTAAAKRYLKSLSTDSDPEVAGDAKFNLQFVLPMDQKRATSWSAPPAQAHRFLNGSAVSPPR